MSQYSHFPPSSATISGSVTVVQPNGALLHTTVDNFPTVQLVTPEFTSTGILSATTSASGGSTFVAFSSQACKQLCVSNQTGVLLDFELNATSPVVQVPNGAFFTFFGLTNASQVSVARDDGSTTQVTLGAVWNS